MNRQDRSGELLVTYLPAKTLVLSSRNARTHSRHQIQQIAASIRTFGFTNPIIIDDTNTIIAGHGRVAAAKLLGIERVPTIRLEGLGPDQLRAYVLADNRLAEKAGWDKATLAIELEHLVTINSSFDVTVTGFEMPEIDLLVQESKGERKQKHIAGAPEPAPIVSKSGDTWLLGTHRIVCGDAVDRRSYEAIDLMIRHWQKYTRKQAVHAVTGKCFDEVSSSAEVNSD